MRALILAGGKGTRLRPLTTTRPKPLVPFMGAPFAEGLLRRLRDSGCDRATFVVGADAGPFAPLRALGADLGLEVGLVAEEIPLDTAGGARRVLEGQGAPVLVCNGDILTDLDYRALIAAHERTAATVTIALTRVVDTSAFGVVVTGPDGTVGRFVEKPAPGEVDADTVNAGTYVLDPTAFRDMSGDGPLSFEREVFPVLLDGGAVLHGMTSEAFWADLGTPERYREGHRSVLDGRCDWPMGAGLVAGPGPSAVHRDAEVGPEAVVAAGTVVGAGARIGAEARVEASVLLDRAVVGEQAVVRDSVVGEGAVLGQGVEVGPDAVLGDGAVVASRHVLPPGARVEPGARIA